MNTLTLNLENVEVDLDVPLDDGGTIHVSGTITIDFDAGTVQAAGLNVTTQPKETAE